MGLGRYTLLLVASLSVLLIMLTPALSAFQSVSIYATVNGKTNLSQINSPVPIEGVYRDSQFYIMKNLENGTFANVTAPNHPITSGFSAIEISGDSVRDAERRDFGETLAESYQECLPDKSFPAIVATNNTVYISAVPAEQGEESGWREIFRRSLEWMAGIR